MAALTFSMKCSERLKCVYVYTLSASISPPLPPLVFKNPLVLQVKGAHARSAIGTNSLPFNVPVEIEAIFDFDDYPASDKLNRW